MAEIPNDIPGNSKRERQQTPEVPRQSDKPEVPVFEGPTAGVKRKTGSPFWRWFKRMFLSDRKPKDILREIVEERIVPGIKDNVRNSAMATIDSFIYPGSSAVPASMSNGINYNKIGAGQSARPVSAPPPREANTPDTEKGFSNPCFKHRRVTTMPDGRREQGAEEFLALLKSYNYPTLSVHTMYMMQGKHIDFTWDAYGWNQDEIQGLGPGCIRPTGNVDWPFMIVLPEAHMIQ